MFPVTYNSKVNRCPTFVKGYTIFQIHVITKNENNIFTCLTSHSSFYLPSDFINPAIPDRELEEFLK